MAEKKRELPDVRAAALKLLAGRELSAFDLENKLLQKGYAPEKALEAVRWTKEQGYQDDTRFAQLYAEFAFLQKHYGRNKVEFELRRRKIDSSIITEAIQAYYDPSVQKTELSILAQRRLAGDGSEKSQARVIRYLIGRGHSVEEARRTVEEAARGLKQEK
jgi:regulatory protein